MIVCSYQPEFLGCQGSDRSGKVLIQADDNKTVDGFWFSCNYNPFRLKYEEGKSCILQRRFENLMISRIS